MLRISFLAFGILILSRLPGDAAFDPSPLEEVSRAYAAAYSGLESYHAVVQSRELTDLLAGLDPASGAQRGVPVLRRTWSRDSATVLYRLEGREISEAMREAAACFAAQQIVEPENVFLPAGQAELRRRLLEKAQVKAHETRLEETRTLHIEAVFSEPSALDGAFYGSGLDLPRQRITILTLELDPIRRIVSRLGITDADGRHLNVEIRHQELPRGGRLPREIRITTPSGSVDDHVVIVFADVRNFRLPGELTRTVRRQGAALKRTIRYSNHQVDPPLN